MTISRGVTDTDCPVASTAYTALSQPHCSNYIYLLYYYIEIYDTIFLYFVYCMKLYWNEELQFTVTGLLCLAGRHHWNQLWSYSQLTPHNLTPFKTEGIIRALSFYWGLPLCQMSLLIILRVNIVTCHSPRRENCWRFKSIFYFYFHFFSQSDHNNETIFLNICGILPVKSFMKYFRILFCKNKVPFCRSTCPFCADTQSSSYKLLFSFKISTAEKTGGEL